MKKILLSLVVVLLLVYINNRAKSDQNSKTSINTNKQDSTQKNSRYIANLFENSRSDVQVRGSGVVVRNLPDDTIGSRHQKFIIRLESGDTLLISHNIDLALRIDTLREGDTVEFYGEYEWSPKGGVVHWTHDDPNGHHADGWIKHNGVIYK